MGSSIYIGNSQINGYFAVIVETGWLSRHVFCSCVYIHIIRGGGGGGVLGEYCCNDALLIF